MMELHGSTVQSWNEKIRVETHTLLKKEKRKRSDLKSPLAVRAAVHDALSSLSVKLSVKNERIVSDDSTYTTHLSYTVLEKSQHHNRSPGQRAKIGLTN